MKKILSIALSVLVLISVFCLTAWADDAASAEVYVTIADQNGKLVLVQEKITVDDRDNDGILTVSDALYCAHEKKYDGGAEAGYSIVHGEWGFSLTKLWGVENGGSYGYYVNNASAMGLGESIKAGDYVNAFIYTDLATWSDTYCFFDVNVKDAIEGDEITLTLSYLGYDADWNSVILPVEGAIITIDGISTEIKTDAEGKATVKLDKAGELVISVTSESQTLVPPVCKVSVSEKASDSVAIVCVIAVVILVAAAAVVVVLKKKKTNEK